jgi:hypothetical protein
MKKNYSGCGDMEKRTAKMCGGKAHKRQGKHMGGGIMAGPTPDFSKLKKMPESKYLQRRPTAPERRAPQRPTTGSPIQNQRILGELGIRRTPKKSTVTPRPSGGPRMPVGRQTPRKSTVTPRPSRRPTRGRGRPRMPRGPMR